MAADHLIAAAASRYTGMGMHLVRLHANQKRPVGAQWNEPENLIKTPADAKRAFEREQFNVGVHLAASGLCSFDPDALPLTRRLLAAAGLDVDQLLDMGWRVEGNPMRARSLFRVPPGLSLSSREYRVPASVARAAGVAVKPDTPDSAIVTVFELRGGGNNKQDVLPPSVHPAGHRYRTLGKEPRTRDEIPILPPQLAELWQHWDDHVGRFDAALGIAPRERQHSPPTPDAPREQSRPQLQPGSYLDIAARWSAANEHDFNALLLRHGYRAAGDGRWLAPGSQSGIPGVQLLKDRRKIISHHGSDILAGDPNAGTPTPRDLFDVWRLLEHDGSRAGAFRAALDELGLDPATLAFGHLETDDSDAPAPVQGAEPQHAVGEAHRGRRPLKTLTPDDLRSLPPMKWLVDQLIPREGLGLFYGASGIGKSFAVLDIAYAVARGVPCYGREVEQGGVLYVAAEGASGFPRRQAAYEKHHKISLSGVEFLLVPEGINLLHDDDVPRVIEASRRLPTVAMIVLDTLNRVMPGGNENSPEDMGAVIARAADIARATGAFVMIVHHSGKDESRGARGHSSLKAAVDTEIELTKVDRTRVITVKKQRDGRDDLTFTFTLNEVSLGFDDATGEEVSAPVVVQSESANAAPGRAPRRPGPHQRRVLAALKRKAEREFDAGDTWMSFDNLCAAVEREMKTDGEVLPDRLRQLIKQGADGLEKRGVIEYADDRYRVKPTF